MLPALAHVLAAHDGDVVLGLARDDAGAAAPLHLFMSIDMAHL
jgi:hypothetical protein